jgi:hypothetical protein
MGVARASQESPALRFIPKLIRLAICLYNAATRNFHTEAQVRNVTEIHKMLDAKE